jgi:lipoic acid synthetase
MTVRRHPNWIKARLPAGEAVVRTTHTLRRFGLATVCEEARCPNVGECFAEGTATFMILGRVCTRHCGFCAVEHGRPQPPDPDEPERLARAAAEMQLRHVVITSVTRDDLADGGGAHFRRCAEAVKAATPDATIEVLVPDFGGSAESLDEVLRAPIDVLNHNVETVPRLYPSVRPEANFERSLALLDCARRRRPTLTTKSGLMLGLGESAAEIEEALLRLREAGCSMLTLGQYLPPGRTQLPVVRYVEPEEFDRWGERARAMGFAHVLSGPLVRSSYHAGSCGRGRAA